MGLMGLMGLIGLMGLMGLSRNPGKGRDLNSGRRVWEFNSQTLTPQEH